MTEWNPAILAMKLELEIMLREINQAKRKVLCNLTQGLRADLTALQGRMLVSRHKGERGKGEKEKEKMEEVGQ